jgi:hypothetical protein
MAAAATLIITALMAVYAKALTCAAKPISQNENKENEEREKKRTAAWYRGFLICDRVTDTNTEAVME